jgi:hypothetical protein
LEALKHASFTDLPRSVVRLQGAAAAANTTGFQVANRPSPLQEQCQKIARAGALHREPSDSPTAELQSPRGADVRLQIA